MCATLEEMNYEGYLLKDAPERVMQFGEGNFLRAFVDYMIDIANEKAKETAERHGIKNYYTDAKEMLQTENEKKAEQEECIKEIETLQKILDESITARVEVTGEAFAGTRICIGDVSMITKNSMTYCKFIKSQGDVKMVAL